MPPVALRVSVEATATLLFFTVPPPLPLTLDKEATFWLSPLRSRIAVLAICTGVVVGRVP